MSRKKNRTFKKKQLTAIRANYVRKSIAEKNDVHISAPYPHFRYYKKSKHPALIVGEQPVDEYRYRKVMHSEYDGKRKNEVVYPNPNPKDNDPMCIGKRIRHDKKDCFENKPLPWIYPKK